MADLNLSPNLMSLLIGGPSEFDRRYGLTKLREQMGGDPPFWGPLNRMLYGIPLNPTYTPEQIQQMIQQQQNESLGISDAVPRRGY